MPSVVYKFIKSKYIPNILKKGEFKITTLHECRNIEKYGAEVGDVEEGTVATENINIDHRGGNVQTGRELERLGIAPGHVLNHPNTKITFENCTVVQNHPNCFMLCLSVKNTRDIGDKINNYDACIKITDFSAFIKAITKCIREKHEIINVLASPIVYSSRRQQFGRDKTRHPAFLKGKIHEYQNEFRIIWTTTEKEINPFLIQCKEATKYCDLVRNSE